jgi:hypothetical protein
MLRVRAVSGRGTNSIKRTRRRNLTYFKPEGAGASSSKDFVENE